jgi:malate synthase
MTVPFMRAYTERLVKICHKHGAHAMGGMSAFIPSRHDEEVNRIAFSQVRKDKEREVADGFDGTWVAHPDLVQVSDNHRHINTSSSMKIRLHSHCLEIQHNT